MYNTFIRDAIELGNTIGAKRTEKMMILMDILAERRGWHLISNGCGSSFKRERLSKNRRIAVRIIHKIRELDSIIEDAHNSIKICRQEGLTKWIEG